MYGRAGSSLSGLIFSDEELSNTASTILTFPKTSEVDYGSAFLTARNKKYCKEFPDVSLPEWWQLQQLSTVYLQCKVLLQWFTAQSCFEKDFRSCLDTSHIQHETQLSSGSETAVLLKRATHGYVISSKRQEDAFKAKTIYSTAAWYVIALHALLTEFRHVNLRQFHKTIRLRASFYCNSQKTKPKALRFWIYWLTLRKCFSLMLGRIKTFLQPKLRPCVEEIWPTLAISFSRTWKRRTIRRHGKVYGKLQQLSVALPHP